MIRRHAAERFYLIQQVEHARLSGQLAGHFGNERFAPPEPRSDTVAAAGLHDAGWPIHDDRPILNHDGLPLDVFETPPELAVRVWRESADRAGPSDYTQLLVSLHVLNLSGLAASRPHSPPEVFALNTFQQYEIERQENLRRRLGLRVDLPLRMGLACRDGDPAEQQLKRNHFILQMADRISLDLCCTELIAPQIQNMVPRPGLAPLTLHVRRLSESCLTVDPWPFNQRELELAVPCRSVPARRFASDDEFQQACGHSPTEHLTFTVRQAP